jgi:hypothetical protein
MLMVMSLPNDFDMDEARDIFLEAFLDAGESSSTIDRGSYGQVSYSLDLLTFEEIDFGIFTLLRAGSGSTPTFAYVFLTPSSMFASEFQAAQGEVTIDGGGLFEGVDGSGLQSQLLAAEPSTGDGADDSADDSADDGTDDAADDTADDATDDTSDDTADDGSDDNGQGKGGLKGADGSDSSDDTGDDATDDTADDSADDTSDATDDTADDTGDDGTESGETGLIDDNTFVSPAYGTVIEWSTSLVLNPDRDPNVVVDDGGIDSLALLLPGDAPTLISVTIVPAQGGSPAAYADFWSSDEYLADSAISSDSEVLLTESSSDVGAVVRLDYTDAGTPLIAYSEARLDEENGSIILIQYFTALQLVEPTLPLVQDGLTVNGEAVLDFFTLEEILEAAEL